MQSPVSPHGTPSDEIDLRDLILTLWNARILVIITTLVITAAAAVYAFQSTPVYETQAQTLPPPASGLASYNTAYQMTGPAAEGVAQRARITDAIPTLSPGDAYQLFLRHASSVSLRQDFFQDHYLPLKSDETPASDAERSHLWNQFNSELLITLPRKAEDNNLMHLTLQGDDPQLISDWLNTYLDMAIARTQEEFAENLSSAVHQRRNSLEEQATTLRAGEQRQREHEIARLEEALILAESIGLEDPPSAGNLITSYSGETTYMRGAKALRSELELLKSRKSDDPFIDELPAIYKRLELLKNIDLSPSHIMVAAIDEPARVPQQPIKPRKALILALGLVLGGMLGIFIALLRQMFQTRPAPEAADAPENPHDRPAGP